MKTEKRLTMALSVLVALMMLAVPLASSSNLFVDGGQTNSNGDAPLIGENAEAGTYILYFDFNAPADSLDVAAVETLPSNISGVQFAKVTDEETDKDLILAYVSQNSTNNVTIGAVITAVNEAITRVGYAPVSWDANDGNSYTESDTKETNYVAGNMKFTVNWELSSVTSDSDVYEFKEFKVNVKVNGGEVKQYVKAYLVTEDSNDEPIVEFNKEINNVKYNTPIGIGETYIPVPDIDSNGYLITEYGADVKDKKDIYYKNVYSVAVIDSDKKTIFNSTLDNQDSNAESVSGDNINNSFDVTYDLISTYTQITVSSILFDKDADDDVNKDVVVYAYKGHSFTYNDLLTFLTDVGPADKEGQVFVDAIPSKINDATGRLLTDDAKYALTGWNGSVLLNSTEKVNETTLTLDAELNSYKVVFMVNGQYEIIEVPFGTALSADMTSLNITGVNHWVTPVTDDAYVSNAFTDFTQFRFHSNEVTAAEDLETFILIACYQSINKTAYAVFNAGENADFGDELVKTIVIPGEINTSVAQLPSEPVKTGKSLFVNWESKNYILENDKYVYKETPETTAVAYSASQNYDAQNNVSAYTARWVPYNHTITFNADSNVNGILYYKGDLMIKSAEDLKSNAVAIEYDGKIYTKPNSDVEKEVNDFNEAYDKILKDSKDGYSVKQWNDASGTAMITFKNDDVDKVNIKEIKSDISLSAQFEAKEYLIAYNGNTATMTNNMPQIGTVDSAVSLFSDAAFSNDGYKLTGWNTRPDGNGTSYKLGDSFTLNGEQYEDLNAAPTGLGLPTDEYEKGFALYAIWEKSSESGSNTEPGNNSDGGNTDTYLLAGILVVIIVLIVVMAVVLRKK